MASKKRAKQTGQVRGKKGDYRGMMREDQKAIGKETRNRDQTDKKQDQKSTDFRQDQRQEQMLACFRMKQ